MKVLGKLLVLGILCLISMYAMYRGLRSSYVKAPSKMSQKSPIDLDFHKISTETSQIDLNLSTRNPVQNVSILEKAQTTAVNPGNLKWKFLQEISSYMEIVAEERIANIEHTCRRLGIEKMNLREMLSQPAYKRPRFYFSDKYKVLLCEVPKCGSTSWRKALLIMEEEVNVTDPDEISGAEASAWGVKRDMWRHFDGSDEKSIQEIEKRFNEYLRIMTVREPFQRLVSAYNDKMLSTGSGGERYGNISKRIHKYYRRPVEDPSGVESEDNGYATWPDFVQYLLDPDKKKKRLMMDPHWDFYSDLCNPCQLHYHYIAKLETISNDAAYISLKLGYDLGNFFPVGREKLRAKKWENKYSAYFETISRTELRELYNMYLNQYELFGYGKPPFVT